MLFMQPVLTRATLIFTLVAGLIGVTSAHATNPWVDSRLPRRTITMDFLYEACSAVGETAHGDVPFFDCESYGYGLIDSYVSIRDSIPSADRACFPADLAPWRALQLAAPLDTPENGRKVAAPIVIQALRHAFPCR